MEKIWHVRTTMHLRVKRARRMRHQCICIHTDMRISGRDLREYASALYKYGTSPTHMLAYIHVHRYMYTCIYFYIHIYAHQCTQYMSYLCITYINIGTCIQKYIPIYITIYGHVCKYAHISTYIHTYTYIYATYAYPCVLL